jgi:hypothetical protein
MTATIHRDVTAPRDCVEPFSDYCQFITHVRVHTQFPEFAVCAICLDEINVNTIKYHLMKCKKIGVYQCCYCQFGNEYLEAHKIHLAKCHPSATALYFERSRITMKGMMRVSDEISRGIHGNQSNSLHSSQ